MFNMHTISLLVAVISTTVFSVANASGTFYLKLDEFENYDGLLSNHLKCDNRRPCDPAFVIKVKGSWGEISNESDCFVDQNHIVFGNTIGRTMTNPLSYAMTSYTLPISIDIRVWDCLFNELGDSIADFYHTLDDLPSPVLFGEPFDIAADSDRIRKIELMSIDPAPISIKLRISLWHGCDRYYYGPNCNKFCNAVRPACSCNSSGVLVCLSAETSPAPTTTTSTTSTSRKPTASSTVSSTPLTSVARPSTSPSTMVSSTAAHTAATTATSRFVSTSKSKLTTENDGELSMLQSLSAPLHLLLLIILALVLIVFISVTVVICSKRRTRPRTVLVSSVRYNRDGIGLDLALGTVNHPQSQYWANQAYNTEDQSLQYGQSVLLQQQQLQQETEPPSARPDSGVYEEPVDLSERDLPPLPPRDAPTVAAPTFKKANK